MRPEVIAYPGPFLVQKYPRPTKHSVGNYTGITLKTLRHIPVTTHTMFIGQRSKSSNYRLNLDTPPRNNRQFLKVKKSAHLSFGSWTRPRGFVILLTSIDGTFKRLTTLPAVLITPGYSLSESKGATLPALIKVFESPVRQECVFSLPESTSSAHPDHRFPAPSSKLCQI